MSWKGIDFIPSGTTIKFLEWRQICIIVSSAFMLFSVALFFSKGLNLGIDFKGGILVEIQSKDKTQIDGNDVRSRLSNLNLGDVQVQGFGKPEDAIVRIEEQPGGDKAQEEALKKIVAALGDKYENRRTETVGATISEELKESGMIAVILAIISVLIYIWFRFEWQFSLGAVAALVHDIVLTIGIFSLLQLEFGLAIIAALLTIVGYSLNDTVVVFDRIRENLRKYKKMALPELLNLSINETLSRTLLTSVTTLIALIALYILGGEVLRGFVFAMIWGVVVGTYSSVFIASPILLVLGVKRDWSGVEGQKSRYGGAQV